MSNKGYQLDSNKFKIDDNIVSEYYNKFIKLDEQYNQLFDNYVDAFKFTFYINKYEYVLPQDLVRLKQYTYKISSYDKRLYALPYILDKSRPYMSIIKYSPLTYQFFQGYEIMYNFMKKGIGKEVLEISAYPTFIESIHFYQRKYYELSNYTLKFMDYYNTNSSETKNNIIKHLRSFIKFSIDIEKEKIDEKFFNSDKKYDFICSTLLAVPTNIMFVDYESIDIQIAILIYIIGHMNKGGSAVIYINQVRTKLYAKLIQFYQDNFKKVILYYPEVQNIYKHSGTFLIVKKFIGPVNYDKLLKLFIKGLNSEDVIISDKLLNYIKNYNENIYLLKYLHMGKLLNLKGLSQDSFNKFIKKNKEKQLVDATLYAQKYDLDYIAYGSSILSKELENKIISDMYSYSLPIIYTFKTLFYNQNVTGLPEKLLEFKRRIYITNHIIDTRDIDRWRLKEITKFYTPLNKELHLIKLLQREFDIGSGSQAWLKMYEMIVDLKLFKDTKTLTTFHLCEAPGNFISAINHYMKTMRPNTKFTWAAQSLKSDDSDLLKKRTAFGDEYGYIKRHPECWQFGDITDPKNTKNYQGLINKADFITSDCGLPYEGEQSINLLKVHVAEIVLILTGISVGKSFLAKFVMPVFTPIQISMIYTIFKSFEETIVYKGVINQFSTEFYIIGKKFKGLNFGMKEKLEKILEDNFNKDYDMYENSYDEGFIQQLLQIFGKLVNNYILNFDKQLFYVDNYDVLKNKNYNDLIMEKNHEWVDRMKMRKIDKKDRL